MLTIPYGEMPIPSKFWNQKSWFVQFQYADAHLSTVLDDLKPGMNKKWCPQIWTFH